MPTPRPTRTLVALAASALLAAGCTSAETTTTSPAATGTGGAQQVHSPSAGSGSATGSASGTASGTATPTATATPAGEGCTPEKYGVPKIDLKGATVGFSQSEKEANPFRIAETQSMKDEAKKLGIKLLVTNAQSQLSKQISDIQQMLTQGAKFIVVAPLNSDGLEPALAAAKARKVPVLTIDRKINAEACSDYLSFLGSNFVQQGKRAADALAKAAGKKGDVAILLGSSGNNVTTDRTKGFVDQLKVVAPEMKIVAQQTGEFARDKGQQVMEQLIQSRPNISAVYAQNDEMALGAIVALRAAGKKPGDDVKIVSVDGTRNAVQAIVDGTINAVIESNPRFGPLALKTARDFYAGTPVPASVIISDREYDKSNAAAEVANAY